MPVCSLCVLATALLAAAQAQRVVVLAPETVQLRFQLASPLVRLETKCDDEVLRVAFSIARAR